MTRTILQAVQKIGQHTDLALAALAIMVIALMVLPLPLLLIDALIAVNIASAIALLTFAMYVPSPLALSTFPSLVLLTTLFRVALDIAITRPILLHAQGGEIIATFGKLVIGGNVVVGLVVFSIITIVQFIVIAKGAERVAEVSARFTLDALPGRQLSIDADLRSGMIEEKEARARRAELTEESQLHGAMDGAMKFIKGDVIAGICIVLINLVGGVTIGVVLKDFEFSKALQTYAVLSVGQGLVSQIPSLLVSLAAGIIVTRSSSNRQHLADAIASEVRGQPKALYVTGVLTLLFVLVPGFPKVAFLLCGAAIALAGWAMVREQRATSGVDNSPVAALAREGARSEPPLIAQEDGPSYAALTLELSSAIIQQLDAQALNTALKAMRHRLVDDLGLPFPGMKLRRKSHYEPDQWSLLLFEEPVHEGRVPAMKAVLASAGQPTGERPRTFAAGEHSEAIIRDLVGFLEPIIRAQAPRLIGVQETQALVKAARQDYPDLVQLALQAAPISRLSDVLRHLLAEGVPIRNMRDILECMVEYGQKEKDDTMLTERCRQTLRLAISRSVLTPSGQIQAVMLSPQAEDVVRKALKSTPSGVVIALPGEQLRQFATELARVAQEARDQQLGKATLVVSGDIRRHLRRLLETPMPDLAVIAYAEIPPQVSVNTLATLNL